MAAISFNSKQYDRQQAKGQNRARQSLDRLYGQFCKQVARIGEATGFADAERELYMSDYPAAQKQLEKLLQSFASDITTTTREGIEDAWNVSDTKNNALLKEVGRGVTLPAHLRDTVRKSSEKALAAFLARKHEGMGLSERVWKVVEPLRGQTELALELGLSQGKSAAALSRDVRDYLLNPDKLFRRVRDKDGVLRLSKAAAGYHPGQGIYRSSYKNALRLTVTETNMAYRSADYAQWANMDFVLGIEVKPSGNHPVADICDELQGRYPKDFMFTGWHPWCRCFATPVLADRKEMNRWARLTEEERKGYTFDGTVTDVPQSFKVWVEDNQDRIAKAKTMPYFLKENEGYWERKKSENMPKDVEAAPQTKTELIAKRKELFERLRKDNYYRDVAFNEENGGLKAIHVEHNFDSNKGLYETTVQDVGYKAGHSVILEKEPQNMYKKRSTEGLWDGMRFEIAGAETATPNNIRNALKHCASKRETDVAVVFFPNGVNIDNLRLGISKYNGLRNSGNGQWKQFKDMVFIDQNGIVSQ